jgi:hypothetical protein
MLNKRGETKTQEKHRDKDERDTPETNTVLANPKKRGLYEYATRPSGQLPSDVTSSASESVGSKLVPLSTFRASGNQSP